MSATSPLIAHVVYRFGVGGLETGIVNLVNRMPVQRWRHAIIALTEVRGEFAERIKRPDVRYIELGKQPGHLWRDYPRLFRVFKDLRPAVVHTRNLAALEAAVPAWAANVPVRVHGEHGWDQHDPAGSRRRYQHVRRLYRPFVHQYVALSRHIQRYLEGPVGIAPERVSQIYNGVDTERFVPPGAARSAIPGCPFGSRAEWLIGWAGRMEAVKDPLNLARAFARICERTPAAQRLRLVLVGGGTLREPLEAFFARVGLRERVWFAGERSDVAEILRGLDCFVLPSLAEGVSNTILEAMASGLPVVATRVGGNGELVESGLSGTLVPPANPEALAGAILGYFADPAAARRHGRAARHVAQRRFSLARMVSDYSRLYEHALGAAGVAVPPIEALSRR